MCLFCLETFRRSLVGLAMEAYIGGGVGPNARGGIHGGEIRPLEPVQEILLDVAHAPLDPALLVAFPDTTGDDGKAVVMGEVQVPRVEHRRLADKVFKHR